MNNAPHLPVSLRDRSRRRAARSVVGISQNQSGGITARTVNITLPPCQCAATLPASAAPPSWKRAWAVMSGLAGFLAATLKILDFFGVRL